MSPQLSNNNTKRTNKNNANCLVYFRKSNPFVIRGPFWEHDGSLGTMEISWGVPGDSEDSVGLNSLCGWDLCKMQLKTESKDMATLRGHHWIYVRLMLKCVAPISFPSATQNKQKKFFMCFEKPVMQYFNMGCLQWAECTLNCAR